MPDIFARTAALLPVVFVPGWFAITTLLSVISGWLSLMVQFPDRREQAIAVFRRRSGLMRGVSFRGLLRISVCRSGLRFGMNRLFGVFSRDFLVPWDQLRMVSVTTFFIKGTQIQFRSGASIVGKLTMAPEDVARIGVAASGVAPPGLFLPAESNLEIGKRLLVQWFIATLFASAFFTLVPRLTSHNLYSPRGAHVHAVADSLPPWPVTVLFPAIAFGLAAIVAYLRGRTNTSHSRTDGIGAK
jgi:hypothetical protein